MIIDIINKLFGNKGNVNIFLIIDVLLLSSIILLVISTTVWFIILYYNYKFILIN